jgi:hypothetical protein
MQRFQRADNMNVRMPFKIENVLPM